MTPTEISVYAPETATILRALMVLSFTGLAGTVSFAFLYGTVHPRLRRAWRRLAHRNDDIEELRTTNEQMTTELLAAARRILDLENVCTAFEKELARVDEIRKRTEDGARVKNLRLENAEAEVRRVRRLIAELEPAE